MPDMFTGQATILLAAAMAPSADGKQDTIDEAKLFKRTGKTFGTFVFFAINEISLSV